MSSALLYGSVFRTRRMHKYLTALWVSIGFMPSLQKFHCHRRKCMSILFKPVIWICQFPLKLKNLKICILQRQMLADVEKTHPNVVSVSYVNYLPIFSECQRSNEKSSLSQYSSVKFIKSYLNSYDIPEENFRTEYKMICL